MRFTLLAVTVLTLSACTDYDPIPVSQCNKVVSHAQKVLGALAPSANELMSQCKSASDSERGCVIASSKKGQLAQCL
ncbi:hypothetical protein [Enterovibrio nigricans]|uniref:Uncharacterized protein n=1 Tax=Enterovibrio nigricans DSM 22720 TaxID=1121868 RepID=A0A1T4UG22_9GAMM|nr:hypothetical protein [Enterovibrio nigricans]PKF51090.1 hypothetical protein AT251_06730 [Enterovibrio nigricans]SKA51637.1 hypothetical protein SAMN02745132_01661 [Enterovibrio nigricans DSM 22720]